MCDRYLTPDQAALEHEWGQLPRLYQYFQSWNFAPTQIGPVVVSEGRNVETRGPTSALRPMSWGFKSQGSMRAWINARSETVFESKAFRYAARTQRCLVPAIGWYEWTGTKSSKQPHLFTRIDGKPFAFAGIWASPESAIYTYAILTRAANDLAAPIHNRMPLIVDPDAYDAWLDGESEPADYLAVLEHPAEEGFEMYPVSTAANKPQNNSPELLQRVAL